jgi:hypothetical protein
MSKLKFSKTTLTALSLIALAGLYYGYYRYTHHSTPYVPDDPKNDAILVHIIIAICTVIAVAAIQIYRNRKQLPNIWKAPFTQNALQRLKATMSLKPFGFLSIPRAVVSFLMAFVILFAPFRMSEQIIGGLDQAQTNNAWGGPSYAGAMAAHYMDMLIIVYVCALILHLVMVKRTATRSM